MDPSLIRLIKASPAPLSVMVRPKASSDLIISISLGLPAIMQWFKVQLNHRFQEKCQRYLYY